MHLTNEPQNTQMQENVISVDYLSNVNLREKHGKDSLDFLCPLPFLLISRQTWSSGFTSTRKKQELCAFASPRFQSRYE